MKKLDGKDTEEDEQCRCALKPCKKTSGREQNKALRNRMSRADSQSTSLFESFTSNLSNLFLPKH